MGCSCHGHLLFYTDSRGRAGLNRTRSVHTVFGLRFTPRSCFISDRYFLRVAEAKKERLNESHFKPRRIMSSDCCSASETTRKDIVFCPRCGEKGKRVSLATV